MGCNVRRLVTEPLGNQVLWKWLLTPAKAGLSAHYSAALAIFFLTIFLFDLFLFHIKARFHLNDFLTGYTPELIIMLSKVAASASTVKPGRDAWHSDEPERAPVTALDPVAARR